MCSCRASVRPLSFALSWEAIETILVAVLTASRLYGAMAETGRSLRRLLPQCRPDDGGLGQHVGSGSGET